MALRRQNYASCNGGVSSSSYGIESRWLKDDDLIGPDNAVAERHKVCCYPIVTLADRSRGRI
jgi:hypothetical protein